MSDVAAPTFPVVEVFGPTIQGEGAMIGLPTYFIRFGGCDDRCAWCDSMHAVDPVHRHTWTKHTVADLLTRLDMLGARPGAWVTLSGGNPALHRLGPLVEALHAAGLKVALETQGTVAPLWLSTLDHLCVSPKPPSSNNTTSPSQVSAILAVAPAHTILKVVVFDRRDLAYALDTFRRHPSVAGALSMGNADTSPDETVDETARRLLTSLRRFLADHVHEVPPHVRVLPQLHALVWGNRQGV